MGFHRLGAEEEGCCDLGVGVAGHDEVGDLPLPLGQRRKSMSAGLAGTGSRVDVMSRPSQFEFGRGAVPVVTSNRQIRWPPPDSSHDRPGMIRLSLDRRPKRQRRLQGRRLGGSLRGKARGLPQHCGDLVGGHHREPRVPVGSDGDPERFAVLDRLGLGDDTTVVDPCDVALGGLGEPDRAVRRGGNALGPGLLGVGEVVTTPVVGLRRPTPCGVNLEMNRAAHPSRWRWTVG